MTWKKPGVVDNCVPVSPFERVQFTISISYQRFNVGKHPGCRFAAVEHRDLVPPGKSIVDLVRTNEAGATENQQAKLPGRWLDRVCAYRQGRKSTQSGG